MATTFAPDPVVPLEHTPVLAVHRREFVEVRELEQRAPSHHKLIWAPVGGLAIQAHGNDWVIPPTHGLWVPAGIPHGSRGVGPGAIYRVRVDPARSPLSWQHPKSIVVGALMRELIVHLADQGADAETRHDGELLLLDLLRSASPEEIHVPLPHDQRARAVAEALIDRPDDDRDLGAWGLEVGASIRTLARLFRAETGMSFRDWRAQVRMRAAFGLLAEGRPASEVAILVGYRTPSAFTAAFRRITGHLPGEVAARHESTIRRPGGVARGPGAG